MSATAWVVNAIPAPRSAIPQRRDERPRRRRVQAGRRLVQQAQTRSGQQLDRNARPLALTAAERTDRDSGPLGQVQFVQDVVACCADPALATASRSPAA